MSEAKCDYTYLTAIQNCGWWLEAFTNYDDAEWYGSTQAL
jgi:hypothetical protein